MHVNPTPSPSLFSAALVTCALVLCCFLPSAAASPEHAPTPENIRTEAPQNDGVARRSKRSKRRAKAKRSRRAPRATRKRTVRRTRRRVTQSRRRVRRVRGTRRGRRIYRTTRFWYPGYVGPYYATGRRTRVDAQGRVVVNHPKARRNRDFSLTLRTVGMAFGEGTTLQGNTLEAESMGGFGFALRKGLTDRVGFEFAVDATTGQTGLYNIASVPVTASVMLRLFPESEVDFFGLAGAGVYFTEHDYHFNAPNASYLLMGAHAGFGAEAKLGPLVVTGDLRFLAVQTPADAYIIDRSQDGSGISDASPESENPALLSQERDGSTNQGMQITLGLGYRW